jgi:superfamily II DNA/RNA helicase
LTPGHGPVPSPSQYLHRSGRAGRLGRTGHVWSILPPEEEFVLVRLMNELRVTATCLGRQPPPREDKLQKSPPAEAQEVDES